MFCKHIKVFVPYEPPHISYQMKIQIQPIGQSEEQKNNPSPNPIKMQRIIQKDVLSLVTINRSLRHMKM